MTDACDGCRGSNPSDIIVCYARRDYRNNDDCPCGNCIIKVLCRETCPDRFDYYLNKRKR